jgi:hypothetical protein
MCSAVRSIIIVWIDFVVFWRESVCISPSEWPGQMKKAFDCVIGTVSAIRWSRCL